MGKDLIDKIYARLTATNLVELPHDLKGGQMGVCLFMILYSKRRRDKQAQDLSTKMLRTIVKEMRDKRTIRLLDGSMGTAWGIRYLALHNFLEEDEEVINMYQRIDNISEYYGTQGPLYIIEGEPLFSGGIYMSQLFVREETLTRYFREERLIEQIDECEKLMTTTIKEIYTPCDMPLTMLHSILFFLQEMSRKEIFPFLVRKLLRIIPKLYTKVRDRNIRDEYIYHFLAKKDYILLEERLDNSYLVELIGDIGFYSLLYHCPELFHSLWIQLERFPALLREAEKNIMKAGVSVETLCGWGYGLLCNKTV